MNEETGKNGITTERKVEAIVNHLADFDSRIRALEARMGALEVWANNVYLVLKPITDEYYKRTKEAVNGAQISGNPDKRSDHLGS